ncbi:MAG: nucleoside recognition domain-containing protein, partial [Clostridia bacterium]
ERVATIRVIPFFSCGAKLPILTAIAGGIVLQFGVGNADLITYGMYVLGIAVAITAVVVMKSTTMKGEVAPFIMELPAYHTPKFKNLMLHLWDKAKHFLKKVFTVILASTIVIWLVSHFSFGWKFVPDIRINESILAGIGQLIQPLFTPLGFGSQLGEWGWVFVVAAITGLIAKENVIATFGTIAACIVAGSQGTIEGMEAVSTIIVATGISVPALIAFIAFNMTTIPCVAAVATAKAELQSKKKFNWTLIFWVLTSYCVGVIIYLVGSWWWTTFIFLAIAAVLITLLVLKNKGKLKLKLCAKKVKKTHKSDCGRTCESCPYHCNVNDCDVKKDKETKERDGTKDHKEIKDEIEKEDVIEK